jgi:hypothetical protein
MSGASQYLPNSGNRWTPLAICGAAGILLSAAWLRLLGVPLAAPALALGAAALLWAAFRHPTFCLGAVLAFMPIDPLSIILARYFGPAFLLSDAFKASDRIVWLLLAGILCWRNGLVLKTPDWFLMGCFGLALARLVFGGDLAALLYDFDFMIPYVAGRAAVLTLSRQEAWAKRAVWIVAVLSVAGMAEVFLIGEGPRTLLYLVAADGSTEGGALNATYHAEGFLGLRESSTMIGPLQFGALCMVALIVWWVYCKSPVPAALIAAGMICTLSRSAWMGAAVALPVLASRMQQARRLLLYSALAGACFVAAIPVVGLHEFLSMTFQGQELSAQGHQESLVAGVTYVLGHPFGAGPGNAGAFAFKNDSYVVWTENSYLELAAEYGIAASLFFVGFLVSALRRLWFERTPLANVAVGLLAGFCAVMMVVPIHHVFSLGSWVWFPVGLAVRNSSAARMPMIPGMQ